MIYLYTDLEKDQLKFWRLFVNGALTMTMTVSR